MCRSQSVIGQFEWAIEVLLFLIFGRVRFLVSRAQPPGTYFYSRMNDDDFT